MKIAVLVAAAVLATIIPSTAVDATSHRHELSNNNNEDSNKPKRLRGENAVLTSRNVKRQQRQLERDGIITRGVVRGEEQLLSMQSIEDEEPVAIIIDEESNTPPTIIEQIDCNTMNKKQCKRVAEVSPIPQCTWDGQVCTSTAQVSFLQVVDVDTCAQYTTQKKCRKNSPCEWQDGESEGSCNTPGFVTGIKPQSTNAPTTYSPTTPYPS